MTEDTPVPGTELALFSRLGQACNQTPLINGFRADRISISKFKRIVAADFRCLFCQRAGKKVLPSAWGFFRHGYIGNLYGTGHFNGPGS